MKTELRLEKHSIEPGRLVVELHYDGKLIGTVVGADGPGVQIITKYPFASPWIDERPPNVMEVKIDAQGTKETQAPSAVQAEPPKGEDFRGFPDFGL